MEPEAMRIDVVSDVVCPWCYIGKRQLEAALAHRAQQHPDEGAPVVVWHAFQLNPDVPPEGTSRDEYLLRKFGSADTRRLFEHVASAAASVGLAMCFERIARQPNTLPAHALIAAMPAGAAQDAMVEALFHAYFVDGADLASREGLIDVAERAGLTRDAACNAIDDREALGAVARSDADMRRNGVTAVPLFLIDRRVAVHGAQGADAILAAFERSRGIRAAAS